MSAASDALSAAKRRFRNHKVLGWSVIGMAAALLLFVVLGTFFDWNLARGPLARLIAAKTGRSVAIDGNLTVHLWSWTPSVEVDGLQIGNPRWAKDPLMFSADSISVSVSIWRLLQGQIVLPSVAVIGPRVHLERDRSGRASWDFSTAAGTPPRTDGTPTRLPTVQSLVIRDGVLDIVDAIRKLTLGGALSAGQQNGKGNASAFELRLTGSLNAKPLKVEFNGGPLLNLNPQTPYNFNVSIAASTLQASAVVSITKPFDLSDFTAKLKVSGDDLATAYYLTGLALPNTAPYDIRADVVRTNELFKIDDLDGRIGSSDIEGSLAVDTGHQRLALKGALSSKNLDLKDLAPALGAAPAPRPAASTGTAKGSPAPARRPDKPQLLLPDADLQLNRVRGMDADVTYDAKSVTAQKVPMKAVSFHIVLVNGELKINPLSFELDRGAVAGVVDIDARQEVPSTVIDLKFDHVELGQFKSAKATVAPISGTLQGRLRVHGVGSSIHKVASTADGRLAIAIPHGEISDVLAELTGVNVLKGLGLLFSADTRKTDIRCGVMEFQAVDGNFKAKTLFIDTTNVLITGRGNVQLGSEDLNIAVQGDPKHLRLFRLRAPFSITGTLADPTFGIKPGQLATQVGAAVALGVLLTPIAAALAFVDPGLAKDKNCVAILAQERNVTEAKKDAPARGQP